MKRTICVIALAGLLGAPTGTALAAPAVRNLQIMGRGGVPAEAPANTVSSLRRAIAVGLDWVQVDLRTTADDKIVDIADATVDRTTNGTGRVSALTCREIRELDAGGCFNPKFRDERVPLFGQELALAKGHVRLLVNLAAADPLHVLGLVRQFDMVGEVAFTGDAKALAALQAAEPAVQVMPALAQASELSLLAAARNLVRSGGPERRAPTARLADSLHPKYVMGAGRLDPAAVKAAHAQAAEFFLDLSGAAATEKKVLAAIGAGVDGVRTDKPQVALAALKRAGVQRPAPGPGPIAWPEPGRRKDSRRTQLIAHRGVMKYAPQNSLEAAAIAIKMGLDYIETDVQKTADNLICNIHNFTVDETTNGHGAVHTLRYADIRKLDAGSWFSPKFKGVYIPLLGEVLAMAKDRCGIYLDWKYADPKVVVELVQDFDMTRDVLVHADDKELLEVRALDPTLPLLPGIEVREGVRAEWESVKPQAIQIRWLPFFEEATQEAHELGMVVVTNLGNGRGDTPPDMRRCVLAGCEIFQTDEPEMALQVLRELQPNLRAGVVSNR